MLNIQIEQNIVSKKTILSFDTNIFFSFTEISLDEKLASVIEIAEDAIGDEVYYTFLKTTNKLDEVTELDEERV
jgi:hypothetical protein